VLGEVFTEDGDGFVVADIPGLIEGAHEGRGLGSRFLRHVERTRLLLHLVDAADPAREIEAQMREVEAELRGYGDAVWGKPRLLVVNKVDALTDEMRAAALEAARATGLETFVISAVTGEGVTALLRAVAARVRAMREAADVGEAA